MKIASLLCGAFSVSRKLDQTGSPASVISTALKALITITCFSRKQSHISKVHWPGSGISLIRLYDTLAMVDYGLLNGCLECFSSSLSLLCDCSAP